MDVAEAGEVYMMESIGVMMWDASMDGKFSSPRNWALVHHRGGNMIWGDLEV